MLSDESFSSTAELEALDLWARKLPEREAIENFLDWLREKGLGDVRFAYSRSDVLDRYHEIDRRALELARRDLLAQAQRGPE